MRVFLAVHLPRLQLEVFRPGWLPDAARAGAVLKRDKVLIAAVAAKAAGVRVGMKRGGVMTLAPETAMYERDVAVALMQFSPEVATLDETVVEADVGASLGLMRWSA